MGIMPAPIPQTLSPTTHPARSRRIAGHTRRDIRPYIGRNRKAKLGICTPALPVCRRSFSPTSCRRACGVPRIRFRHRFDSHSSGGLARGGPSTRCAVYMFQSAHHCGCGWIIGHTICAFFGEGVLDIEAACGIKGDYFSILCFHDTGPYDHCASLPRCSTIP